jgi:DNA-binding beta-propeller fold protein YncE
VAARVPVDVVVPVDLVTQQARPPIVLPVSGPTHGVALMANGRTLLVAVGTDVLPVDVVTHDVGRPLDLGPGRTIFGLALDPRSPTLYALVDGGVVPVDTATATAGAFLPTGLSVSSVYSPHGIVVTPDGRTVYVVGQGGGEYGGRLLALDAATGATGPEVSFDRFGIADPAAVAVTPDGSTVLVADAANNWIDTVETSSVTTAVQPVSLPSAVGGSTDTGTDHPTDLVVGPAADGAFVVDSFGAVLPYSWSTRRFGHPVAVCSGASSMVVAPAP